MQKTTFALLFTCILIFLLLLTTGNALADYYTIPWGAANSHAEVQQMHVKASYRSPSLLSPTLTRAVVPTSVLTPSITHTPSQMPSPSSKTTITPIAHPMPSPTAVPATNTPAASIASVASTGVTLNSVQQYILDGINNYRKSQGLSEVKADTSTCGFASTRAQEIASSFTHDGFQNRINNQSLPYSSYHSVTENIAMTSDYMQVVPMWIASAGHAENMRADTPFVCVAQSGNNFAYEGWKP